MAYRKYRNRKATYRGQQFDSKKEAERYIYLRQLERNGVISDLQQQVKYVLIPAQYEPTGELYQRGARKGEPKMKLVERKCSYVADFAYQKDGQTVVEDVKGYRDGGAYALFKIKRKLMLYVHGIKVIEI